jgi:hypothetical protein
VARACGSALAAQPQMSCTLGIHHARIQSVWSSVASASTPSTLPEPPEATMGSARKLRSPRSWCSARKSPGSWPAAARPTACSTTALPVAATRSTLVPEPATARACA